MPRRQVINHFWRTGWGLQRFNHNWHGGHFGQDNIVSFMLTSPYEIYFHLRLAPSNGGKYHWKKQVTVSISLASTVTVNKSTRLWNVVSNLAEIISQNSYDLLLFFSYWSITVFNFTYLTPTLLRPSLPPLPVNCTCTKNIVQLPYLPPWDRNLTVPACFLFKKPIDVRFSRLNTNGILFYRFRLFIRAALRERALTDKCKMYNSFTKRSET